ncbi:histidine phosphatase family protein [Streptomyces sp. T028]|uniref:histidine phosphatase family protein n=1 Tax=Streptomyces sp. T028 TaxID=3394379 RepID=UPI003A8667C9
MTSRVTFVSPAMNDSLRQARFDDGCSLDAGGRARARAAAGSLPPAVRVVVSPSARCRETAAALGLDGVEEEPLAGLDVGRWRGLTLAEAGAAEPQEVGRWMADPQSAPHGGESVVDLCARVGDWLRAASETDGHTVVVVEPEIVRAVVTEVLGAPAAAFWRLDVPPLTATSVSGRDGRWNVRLGQALGPDPAEGQSA